MSVYRAPIEKSVECPPPCICWASNEVKAIWNPVGGWHHTRACQSYQERHPEMLTPVRHLILSTKWPWVSWRIMNWRWSKEAVALRRNT